MSINCTDRCVNYCAPDEGAVGATNVGDGNCRCKCGGCPRTGCPTAPKKKPMRKMRFGGMNPVRQRPIGVNPSQGGFFSVPTDERNIGQQSSLPYEQQLNMNHMSNFGANTASTTWSGSQSNVGPQDRIFAGNYASGCGYSNMNHGHSNFVSGGNDNAIWSGVKSNVGPQDRIFAGNYASGSQEPYSNFVTCYNDYCCRNAAFKDCGGQSNTHSWDIASGGEGCNWSCIGGEMTTGGGVYQDRQPKKALRTRLGGGRGGSMRRTSRR